MRVLPADAQVFERPVGTGADVPFALVATSHGSLGTSLAQRRREGRGFQRSGCAQRQKRDLGATTESLAVMMPRTKTWFYPDVTKTSRMAPIGPNGLGTRVVQKGTGSATRCATHFDVSPKGVWDAR